MQGTVHCGAGGAGICSAFEDQYNSAIFSDAAGGAIIAWDDYRGGSNYDIYAQEIGREER